MGEPAPDVFEEARKLSFAQLFGHKNLKVRIDAFEQLRETVFLNKLLPPQDPRVEEAVGFIPLGLNDANAVVKDKALGALVSVFNKIKEPQNYNKYADEVLPVIISNCLKEQKSLKKCKEACLLFVEYEQGEKVIDNLVVATKNKTPKIQLNAVKIIAEILSEFGTRAVPWKKILPVTVALSESRDYKIRAHIKEILNSVAKHEGGNAIRQLVYPKFREAFQKDISAILEIQKTAATEIEPEFWEDATPQNITPLFNSSFFSAMEKGKWKEKVSVLKESIGKKLSKVFRMAPPDNLGEIVKALKTAIQKDSNINVIGESAQTVAYLAKGIRQPFGVYARGIVPALLERQKEKNQVASAKISECLDFGAQYCYSLTDIADDLKTALQHKNLRVRELTCRFIVRSSRNEESSYISISIQQLCQSIVALLSDAIVAVRDQAAEILAVFYSRLKSPSILKLLQSLDESKQQKILELAQKHSTQSKVCECHRSIDNCRATFEHHILQCHVPNIYDAIEAMKLSCYELMEVQNSFSNIQTKYEELKAVYKQDVDQAISTLVRQVVIFLGARQQMQQQQAAASYSTQGTSNNNVLTQQSEQYQLSIIFKKIGQKETQQQGLEQLQDFLQLHPNISLDNCLTSASKDSKNFVGSALNRIKQQKEIS